MGKSLNEQLWEAVRYGRIRSVLSLIRRGADINSMDRRGYTSLHYACVWNDKDLALLLLDKGADMYTYRFGDDNSSDYIFSDDDSYADERDGLTPLTMACTAGHIDIAMLLLDRVADRSYINSHDGWGQTLLHTACINGQTDIAMMLIDRGADLTIENRGEWNDSDSPLHSACQKGCRDIALALVRAGADTLAKNVHDMTPLDLVGESYDDDSVCDATPLDNAESEDFKSALIREREKYLIWMRRKAVMMFLVGYRYIALGHYQPQEAAAAAAAAAQQCKEPLIDKVM